MVFLYQGNVSLLKRNSAPHNHNPKTTLQHYRVSALFTDHSHLVPSRCLSVFPVYCCFPFWTQGVVQYCLCSQRLTIHLCATAFIAQDFEKEVSIIMSVATLVTQVKTSCPENMRGAITAHQRLGSNGLFLVALVFLHRKMLWHSVSHLAMSKLQKHRDTLWLLVRLNISRRAVAMGVCGAFFHHDNVDIGRPLVHHHRSNSSFFQFVDQWWVVESERRGH